MGGKKRNTNNADWTELWALLRRLGGDGAVLRMDDQRTYSLFRAGRRAGALPAAAVRMLAGHDLLRAVPGANREFMLSDAGHALLRRRLAQGDDSFRAQHRLAGTRALAPGEDPVAVNLAETPLGWLARRRGPDGKPFLDTDEFEAGERLRADFTYASLTPRLTQHWAEPIGGGRGRAEADPRDSQIAAKQRFLRALDAAGPGLSDVLVAVCCHLQGLEDAERAFHWPARSGKVVLKIALGRLAEHYRSGARRRRAAPRPGT
jgi:hypothetical protein